LDSSAAAGKEFTLKKGRVRAGESFVEVHGFIKTKSRQLVQAGKRFTEGQKDTESRPASFCDVVQVCYKVLGKKT